MTIFDADNDDLKRIVDALNKRLHDTFPPSKNVVQAAVTLEEAQIAVGCVDSTPECWTAVADPIPTAALLIAEVKEEGAHGVRMGLRLFDAMGLKVLRLAERVYPGPDEALVGVDEVVDAFVKPQGAE